MIQVRRIRIHKCNGEMVTDVQKIEKAMNFSSKSELESYRKSREIELQAEQPEDVKVLISFDYIEKP